MPITKRREYAYSVMCFQLLMEGCVTSESECILFLIVHVIYLQFTCQKQSIFSIKYST